MAEPIKGDPNEDERIYNMVEKVYDEFHRNKSENIKQVKRDYLIRMKMYFDSCSEICNTFIGYRDNQSEGGKKNKKTK